MVRVVATRLLLAGLGCAVLTGCGTDPNRDRASVTIGSATVASRFQVELAQTAEEQRDGLTGRDQLPAGTGMLFQFRTRSQQQVWMAGMTFPVDIAWIADGRVVATDTVPPCTTAEQRQCPRWTSPGPVDALLEVPARSLASVTPGTPIAIEDLQ